MSVSLKKIKKIITKEMDEFEVKFHASMKTNVFLLDKVLSYIVKRKGKQIRPILVFLSAGASGAISESTFRGASLVELLHTATLLHDDVVDDADYRRGVFSVNAMWKNKVAILAGDFLLSRGLLLAVENNDFDLLRILSHAVKDMSEGELLQIEKARGLDITEEVYYKIIDQKTASLIASCCGVGAYSAGSSKEIVEQMSLFGRYLGMAFQLSDDLLDYGEASIGKPKGIDIKGGKITLPLIYALSQSSWLEKRKIMKIMKADSRKLKDVKEVIAYVRDSGGIEYARKHINGFRDKAHIVLAKLPMSLYKDSLSQLVQFTVDREG